MTAKNGAPDAKPGAPDFTPLLKEFERLMQDHGLVAAICATSGCLGTALALYERKKSSVIPPVPRSSVMDYITNLIKRCYTKAQEDSSTLAVDAGNLTLYGPEGRPPSPEPMEIWE